MSGAIGAQEDIYGNFSGTGRQFMGTAQISSNDFGIAVSSDDAEEDASSSEEVSPFVCAQICETHLTLMLPVCRCGMPRRGRR